MADAPDQLVYLITGSDRPKIETALARLRSHFASEAIETVSALEASGEEVAGMCNAGSLFGDARLVVVTEIDGIKADRGRRGGWKAADVQSIDAYLGSPAPATVLALVADELKSSSALWKACAKAGSVLSFDVDKKLADWVAKRFHERGVRSEPDAVAALITLVGDNPRTLETEVDKVATWADGEPVGEREIEALVAPTAEIPIWELTEAWSGRDAARALEVSEVLFERESRQRRDTAARVVGALGGHLGHLRGLRRLTSEGVKPKEAAERLKLHPFRAQKLQRQAEGFSEEELDDAVVQVAALDGALKGQSRLTPDLELQRTLVELMRRPGAAPPATR